MTQIQFNEKVAREVAGGVRCGKIKTKLGLGVRIICWNAKGDRPIVALVEQAYGEKPYRYTVEGKRLPNGNSSLDLVIETEGGEV